MRLQRVKGSLRSEGGITMVAVDTYTKENLKQLAGDMPLSHYVRSLAQRELSKTGKGKALPGLEHLVSEASLPGIGEKLSLMAVSFDDSFNKMFSLLSGGHLIVTNKPAGEQSPLELGIQRASGIIVKALAPRLRLAVELVLKGKIKVEQGVTLEYA